MLLAKVRDFGKLIEPGHAETMGLSQKTSKRLHIHDRKSGLVFLIDTGSDVSILPVKKKESTRPSDLVLFAANDTRLQTFGEKRISPNLNLRMRLRQWHLYILISENREEMTNVK